MNGEDLQIGNTFRGQNNLKLFKIVEIKKEIDGCTYVRFQDLKTGKINDVEYNNALRLEMVKVNEN